MLNDNFHVILLTVSLLIKGKFPCLVFSFFKDAFLNFKLFLKHEQAMYNLLVRSSRFPSKLKFRHFVIQFILFVFGISVINGVVLSW